MRGIKVVLGAAFVLGSIAAASAQGAGGGSGGGGGDSPTAKSGQGASSSPRYANPAATLNDTKERGGNAMMRSSRSHKYHRQHHRM